jgi:hypothetical protein
VSTSIKHYPPQDHEALGAFYTNHVDAMAREGLHGRGAIAGQLAARDMEIARLQGLVQVVDQPPRSISDEAIRHVLIECGYTIKPGTLDLDTYVFKAARELLRRHGGAPVEMPVTPKAQRRHDLLLTRKDQQIKDLKGARDHWRDMADKLTQDKAASASRSSVVAHSIPSREGLADLFAELLTDVYHCTRVWSAWGFGTMSEDDFEPVDCSDTPIELADAVLAKLKAMPLTGGDERRHVICLCPDCVKPKTAAITPCADCDMPQCRDAGRCEHPTVAPAEPFRHIRVLPDEKGEFVYPGIIDRWEREHITRTLGDELIPVYAAPVAPAIRRNGCEYLSRPGTICNKCGREHIAPVVPATDVRTILLDVVPGEDGQGVEVYAKSVDDVVAAITKMGERIEELESQMATPVAPAEYQPVGVPDAAWEALQRMIEDGATKGLAGKEDALLVARYRARLVAPLVTPAKPIDMVLHCPVCGVQHIDAPEPMNYKADADNCSVVESHWCNPPHRSHLCHGCGHVWRPADVPTNGVATIKTRGEADTPVAPPTAPADSVATLWAIYIPGPLDHHAAPSEAAARHMAARHNEAINEYFDRHPDPRGMGPTRESCTARVVAWPWPADEHAEELKGFDAEAWGLDAEGGAA